jgi:hypothetical protein
MMHAAHVVTHQFVAVAFLILLADDLFLTPLRFCWQVNSTDRQTDAKVDAVDFRLFRIPEQP